MRDTPNIILVVFDTMRKDALDGSKSVNLSAFARDSVIYDKCVAPSSWTIPSHASAFTGLYPSEHGVHESFDTKVPELRTKMDTTQFKPVAELIGRNGFNAVGISTNPHICPGSGFDRGFGVFSSVDDLGRTALERETLSKGGSGARREAIRELISKGKFSDLVQLYSVYRKTRKRLKEKKYPFVKGGDLVVNSVLDSRIEQPFFLFVNFMEMHDPHDLWEFDRDFYPLFTDLFGIKKIPENIMERIRRQYYLSTPFVDSFFGYLIKYLKEHGTYDNSLIIATSDHGQALKERGFYGHGIYLYDEIIQVPLYVKYPRNLNKPKVGGAYYQSLVDVKDLISRFAEDGKISEEEKILSQESVFSETFGIQFGLDALKKAEDQDRVANLRKIFDVPRKAVYKKDYKLVINGGTGKIEEFSLKGKAIDPKENKALVEDLTQEISIFKGTDNSFLLSEKK